MNHPALTLRGVEYRTPERLLLTDVHLTLRAGESVALTGPSGSGKSTVLSSVLGLLRPAAGVIEVLGKDVTRLGGTALARLRSRYIGMVFQFGELLPELSPLENVMLAGQLAGTDRRRARIAAQQLLAEVGVPEGTPTGALSGGERQRLAVARALVNRPALLLADEPTGALDDINRQKIAELLYSLPQRWNCGLLLVTHDLAVAGMADRQVSLSGQRLREAAPWRA